MGSALSGSLPSSAEKTPMSMGTSVWSSFQSSVPPLAASNTAKVTGKLPSTGSPAAVRTTPCTLSSAGTAASATNGAARSTARVAATAERQRREMLRFMMAPFGVRLTPLRNP